MLAAHTTVVAVVAGADAAPLASVRAANVRVVPAGDGAPVERATKAYEEARRTTLPYLVHDADPLAWVATPGPASSTATAWPVTSRWR